MKNDPILEELYAAREKLLADVGGDVHKYLEGVRQREAASGRLLPPSPRGTDGCIVADSLVADGQTAPSAR